MMLSKVLTSMVDIVESLTLKFGGAASGTKDRKLLIIRTPLSDKILSDKINDGQNVSSDEIFDTKPKFRQFCPTNFCPIRY